MSEEGLKKLETELENLKTVKRHEVSERIKTAREFGDISENSEYEDAKNEQAFVEGRIQTIEKMLRQAKVVDNHNVDPNAVHIGSVVTVKDLEEDFEEEWALPASVISPKNLNLTRAQVELLKYHFRFGHFHLGWIQRLMRPRNQDKPPIIIARQVGSSSCKLPLCSACQLGKQTKRPTGAAIR